MQFFPSDLPCGVFSFGLQPKDKVVKTKKQLRGDRQIGVWNPNQKYPQTK